MIGRSPYTLNASNVRTISQIPVTQAGQRWSVSALLIVACASPAFPETSKPGLLL